MFHTFVNTPVLSTTVGADAGLPMQAPPGGAIACGPGSSHVINSPGQCNLGGNATATTESVSAATGVVQPAGTANTEAAVLPWHSPLASVYPEWSTGDLQLDQWLQLKMQSQEVFVKLAQIPVRDRRQLVSASRRKEDDIMNMTSYILGCIRKVHGGSPAALVRNAQHTGQQPHVGQMAAQARPPATPQQMLPGLALLPARQQQQSMSPTTATRDAQPQALSIAQPMAANGKLHLDPITLSPKPASNEPHVPERSQACNAPEWVRNAMNDSDKPSAFVAAVLQQLPPVLRTVLDGLQNPGLQYRLCFALVLDGSGWADPGPAMEALLRTYSVLAPGSQIETALGKAGGTLKLVLLHCCNGLGTSHLVMHAALRILATSRPGIEIDIVENFAFEIHKRTLSLQTALTEALGVAVQQVGDIALLPLLVQQSAPRWQQKKAVICFINSWPCKNTSRAAPMKDRPAGSGLHMQHSRKMWDIDNAMHVLQQMKTEAHYIAHMTEYPQCGNEAGEDTIDKIFGKAFVSNPSCYGGASRARNIRTSPSKLGLKMFHHPINPHAPIDGWTWCGNGEGMESKHPQLTLRSYITALMETQLYGTRQLEPWEANTLARMRMVHGTTGKVNYISRAFWLLWLGFDKTPVPEIADAQLPCLGNISLATGSPAKVDSPGCTTCGEKRYCKNCEELMQMLGQAWHVRSMTDVAAAWLDKMVARHCQNDLSVEWPTRPEAPPHTCGPHCEHNPRPGF